jgi:hypothetical protein
MELLSFRGTHSQKVLSTVTFFNFFNCPLGEENAPVCLQSTRVFLYFFRALKSAFAAVTFDIVHIIGY